MTIPFNKPYLSGREEEYLRDALQSRAHCGNRTYTEKCIRLMKEKYGFGEVFLTPSCTAAMEMGAMLADLSPGDEVILPSWTFSSTANAVVLRGAKPVFCDVDPKTMNIDVTLIEGLITERTRLIMPIDYMGIPCDMDVISAIAQRHNLMVLEDAAQSFHSYLNGNPCGTHATMAAFSFHESKNLSCGEGGALIVNDPALVERAAFLQEKGTDRSLVIKGLRAKYGWVDIGSSFLLADLLAAVLFAQLEAVDEIVTLRSRITAGYYDLYQPYADKGYLALPIIPENVLLNHHAYFVIFDTDENQQRFLKLCRDRDVYPFRGYLPLHSSVMGRKFGYQPEEVPMTEALSERIVRLPFYTDLANEGLEICLEAMRAVLQELYGC
ncbi:dTDP-4-amino-4,6-dideoxygalactose transaminase [bacterium]|nr:dTDP-4-amino-4,6-dideoxygalactose transaminase [bacterium]MBU1652246.1 dTDP-4-amino-4,6-dideoxygalactose transaminase [bacterium]MBU1881014.1 dTDP-4-amino-4,6-dideoxygalactose transaminase [bacterium]